MAEEGIAPPPIARARHRPRENREKKNIRNVKVFATIFNSYLVRERSTSNSYRVARALPTRRIKPAFSKPEKSRRNVISDTRNFRKHSGTPKKRLLPSSSRILSCRILSVDTGAQPLHQVQTPDPKQAYRGVFRRKKPAPALPPASDIPARSPRSSKRDFPKAPADAKIA